MARGFKLYLTGGYKTCVLKYEEKNHPSVSILRDLGN